MLIGNIIITQNIYKCYSIGTLDCLIKKNIFNNLNIWSQILLETLKFIFKN